MAVRYLLILSFLIIMELCRCNKTDKINYFATERVNITWLNHKYLKYFTARSLRYSRSDPVYYFNAEMGTKYTLDNNFVISFYFYEWLTNVYKRSFVEMHFGICDLINKDLFFGTALRKSNMTCPLPPGDYLLSNCTIPSAAIPNSFPFKKGRIYVNATYTPKDEMVAYGHIDFELRQMKKKKN